VALKRSRTSSRFLLATACKPRLCDLNANAILPANPAATTPTLGLHDGNVLSADHVLEAPQLFIRRLGRVVERHNQPGNTLALVHWRHTTEDGEPSVLMRLQKVGG